MHNLTQEDFLRYKRQMVLPEFGTSAQEKLKNAKVLVVGAGGLGCPVLQCLAAAGVGCIGIVEFDLIDFTNLQRQVLFASDEVGRSKLEIAKQKIQAQNPSLEIIPFNTKLVKDNALEIISDFELVIDCSDNFATKYLINDACCILNKPFVYASILRYEGQLSVFNFSQNNLPKVTYRCLFPEPCQNDLAPSCADSGVLGSLAGIIGSMQAQEAIKIITGIGEVFSAKLLVYNSLNNNFITFNIKPSLNPRITQLQENYTFNCETRMKREITVSELKKMRDNHQDFQLIDVREESEFKKCNINAELIPLNTIAENIDKISRTKKVVIHCHHGGRSGRAVDFLSSKHGFDNVYNLVGGIDAWSLEIDPTVARY